MIRRERNAMFMYHTALRNVEVGIAHDAEMVAPFVSFKTRKYGVPDGSTPGRETIMDKHFPVLQPEQLKRFRISCELFRTKNDKEKKRGKRAKVRFARERDDLDTKSLRCER
jgi:hypothetical protein